MIVDEITRPINRIVKLWEAPSPMCLLDGVGEHLPGGARSNRSDRVGQQVAPSTSDEPCWPAPRGR